MKRILLVCFLLTATCTVFSVQHATAQTTPVTSASFMVKVNAMDAFIAAGNMTSAQATWNDIHTDMLSVLAATKTSIRTAATPALEATYTTLMTDQRTIYWDIWQLHTDLALNRTAINTKLTAFSATIH